MNISKQSFNCPIIDGCIPTNADEIAAELCKLYYKGIIYDDMPEYETQKYISLIKERLAENGQNEQFVNTIKETYKENLFSPNTKKSIIDDEEEQKILNEFSNNKKK